MGHEIARRYEIRNGFEEISKVCQTPEAAVDAGDNLITTNRYYGNDKGNFIGDIQTVINPDGTASLYQYSPNEECAAYRSNIVMTGAMSGGTVGDGAKNITIISLDGVMLGWASQCHHRIRLCHL